MGRRSKPATRRRLPFPPLEQILQGVHAVMPASRNARSPCSGVRFAIATRRIPGTGVPSCRAMARPGRTGSNHSYADRMTRGLALLKGGIYNNGRLLFHDMSSSKAMFCFTSFAFRVNLLPLN